MKRYVLGCLLMLLTIDVAQALGWRRSSESEATAALEESYDPKTEVTFSGTIVQIDPAPCATLPVSTYHVHIQTESERVEIHMGPCWYMADRKPAFNVGESVQGVGSQASWKSGDRRVIIAREVRRGEKVLRLRDVTGKPVWR